ncbi:TPA: hypothetical protein KO426_002332 [Clostridioides difficile]|nr:hypothetical protein [Clostridioides difficile]HBF8969997.1 hypothetical protein [Clostridioides difficile]HBF9837232.1 hypothetical protein [Clostridioides difficile]HBG4547493.1 hypothetical protein [Clostridioides difficile]HBZ0367742.1 hypothetical protein [Clostridioides difficile]
MSLLITIVLLAIAIYLILAEILNIPTYRNNKIMGKVLKMNKDGKYIDNLTTHMSIKLSKFIKISEERKEKISYLLKVSGIRLSPETFIANAFVSSIIMLIFFIPTYLIMPSVSVIWIILAIYAFRVEIKKPYRLLKDKKRKIECNLADFSATLAIELEHSRNLVRIFEGYKEFANPDFAEELEITLADMKSGSDKQALKRFDTRIGSSYLTEVIIGLIGVIDGNDEVSYFSNLSDKLEKFEFEELSSIALGQKSKVAKYEIIMLTVIVMIILVAFASLFLKYSKELF